MVIHYLAAAANVAAAAPSQESNNPLLPNISELIVGTLAFLLMFGFLWWKVFPKISATYAERTDKIEGGIQRAEQAQAEAQHSLEEYRTQLAEARHEASRLRELAQAERQHIVDEAADEARARAETLIGQARAQIEADRQQAMASLRSEIGRLAVDLAGRIVGESLEDEARQRRTVDRFLADLEQDTPAGSRPAEQVH